MNGRVHLVDQGESIESLAYLEGVLPATIWDHPDNSHLREVSRTKHVLQPGDAVFIPQRREKVEPCITEARHRFVRAVRPSRLHVRFLDDDTPRANAVYTIRIDGKEPMRGTTDSAGYIDHVISPLARAAAVHFERDTEDAIFELWLGHLNPASSPSGVQQRLRNLGLYWGDASDEWDEETSRALAGFQQVHGLEPTGILDDVTRDALVRVQGS